MTRWRHPSPQPPGELCPGQRVGRHWWPRLSSGSPGSMLGRTYPGTSSRGSGWGGPSMPWSLLSCRGAVDRTVPPVEQREQPPVVGGRRQAERRSGHPVDAGPGWLRAKASTARSSGSRQPTGSDSCSSTKVIFRAEVVLTTRRARGRRRWLRRPPGRIPRVDVRSPGVRRGPHLRLGPSTTLSLGPPRGGGAGLARSSRSCQATRD